jgi:hypothetical protein
MYGLLIDSSFSFLLKNGTAMVEMKMEKMRRLCLKVEKENGFKRKKGLI